ncbi:MAG: leucyl aminopeptidase family protein [Myxococcota bacterium]
MRRRSLKSSACFAAKATKSTLVVHVHTLASAKSWLKKQPAEVRAWVRDIGVSLKVGTVLLVPKRAGGVGSVLFVRSDAPTPWQAAKLPAALPKGRYSLRGASGSVAETLAFGWALSEYRYDKYKDSPRIPRELVWPKGVDKKRVLRLADATYLVRDLITTPANDMLPADLEATARGLAKKHKARVTVTTGDALLAKYPTVHAVGRASDNAPRVIDLRWGNAKHPKVTLVGKGVCFDSGGLDLKSAAGMLLMKKDMGGAAHVLGLAHAIMDAKLPVRLRVFVPAVENSVSGNAFRPLDVIKSAKGLTVEIGNTDAEGRLIMCDCLHHASKDNPEVLIDFATLTGAARVALGTELPALFCNDDRLAGEILTQGTKAHDPLWRMPLWDAYERYLDSRVADTSNTGSTRFGGAITAALFLRKFVDPAISWVHIDVMAWNSENRTGRPKGGEAMGLRALYSMLERRYG